jgi:hypothetical protein
MSRTVSVMALASGPFSYRPPALAAAAPAASARRPCPSTSPPGWRPAARRRPSGHRPGRLGETDHPSDGRRRAANVPPTAMPCPASSTPRRCRAWPHSATSGLRRPRGTTIRRGCGLRRRTAGTGHGDDAIVPRPLITGRRASSVGVGVGVGRHEDLIGPGRCAQNETARAPCQSPVRAEDRGCATGGPSWTSRVRASWRRASGSRSAHSAA